MKNVDVYLKPLIEEVEELWRGIKVIDLSKPTLTRDFFSNIVLMWMMHNFLGYRDCLGKY